MSIAIAVVTIILFAWIGIDVLRNNKKYNRELYVTPWSNKQTWLIYIALMVNLVWNLIEAIGRG